MNRTIEPNLTARISNGKNIYLVVTAATGAEYAEYAERTMREPDQHRRYVRSPGLRIPLFRLNERYRAAVIKALFPKDSSSGDGWSHRVTYADNSSDGGESLWRIAEWFTGRGTNWTQIAAHNGVSGKRPLRVGDTVEIPNYLLVSAHRQTAPPPQASSPAAAVKASASGGAASGGCGLRFGQDNNGMYAVYRLGRRETIYRDVVIRFTGRVRHDAVMDASKIISLRSGIRNANNVKVGQVVKIPIDLLHASCLPAGDPRSQQWREEQKIVRQAIPAPRSKKLAGITIVLDSGHGGRDPGTIGTRGTPEDEVAYDVMVRVKHILESETFATVHVLVRDRSQGWRPSEVSGFRKDSDEILLTNPTYALTNPKAGVNLRWYLANAHYRNAIARGAKPEAVLFTSFHADALHPSVYGTMFYVADTKYSSHGRKSKHTGRFYEKFASVRSEGAVNLSYKQRLNAERYGRQFSAELMRAWAQRGLPLHRDQPVRDVIYRGSKKYVPGVLRNNRIPVKVLVELGNLKNSKDEQRLRNPAFRQRLARAYVDGVISFYHAANGGGATALARN